MSGMIGADVGELRALAREFADKATTINGIKSTLDVAVNRLPGYWHGMDADRFAGQWRSSQRIKLTSTADLLDETAKLLARNADEQEKASSSNGPSGVPFPGGPFPGGPGGASGNGPWGPDWLSSGSPFRDGWKQYGNLKNALGLPKNLYGLGWMGSKGWDMFKDASQWGKLAARSAPFNLMDSATDLVGLKNLNKYFPQLGSMKGFFAEAPMLFKGTGAEWLGKGGLGRGLGWLGVGLSGFDTAQNIAKGDVGGAIYSGAKTALGVACFLPPPAGTVAQVASAAWAIYEIPAVKSFVDNGVKAVGDGIAAAVSNPGKFATDVGKGIGDLGKGAAKFFGFG